ncbi:hypothetical protein [Streptomyces sp. NPDC048612]|uniref:hypothetical protein n=1 Tax=Streptomyces sp. NPDC048612 TaxID=3365579 RepID=UPI003723B771
MTQLEAILRGLTVALVIVATGCLAFTATNVTEFALNHGVSAWIAWMLDPLVASALGTVLVVDGLLTEHEVRPGGMASLLRWFAGLATWLMNCWGSLWPTGTPFGLPTHLDPAGLLLHSVLPVLLVLLAEAITAYRRRIVARIAELLDAVDTTPARVDTPVPASVPRTPEPVLTAPVPRVAPQPAPTPARPLVAICGSGGLYRPEVPAAPVPRVEPVVEPVELSAEEAARIIEQCWREGVLSIRKTAELADRSKSFVEKCFGQLVEHYGPRPAPQQMALAGVSA